MNNFRNLLINLVGHFFTVVGLRTYFSTKEGGSGLGLATVKRIVEGLKGRVFGDNHPDGGAEVTIILHPSPSLKPWVNFGS